MTTDAIGPGVLLGGRYRLDDLLSETDGARFWRGVDTVLGRSVAIHTVAGDDPRAERLMAAARDSATVSETHLLRVLDCDAGDEVTWVVNEWGWGTSLDVMLQQGPLPASRAAWLVREVAESIAAAHAAGVSHGRLTPESVLVTEAGAVKLIGFVVTAAVEGPATAEPCVRERGYGDLDGRQADVVDLASLLYAALTARWPGISPSAVPRAPTDHGGPLRPRQVRAGVPRMLDAICSRVLRKEAQSHALPIESAHELLAALEDQVGDPLASAPLDVQSMHTEPTVAIRRDQLPAPFGPERPDERPTGRPDEPGPPALLDTQPSLPPYEEHPDRPLFAGTERRTPLPDADRGSSAWLFGDDTGSAPPADDTAVPTDGRHPLRTMLIAAGVVVLLVAMVLAFELGHDHHTPSASTHPTPSGSARPTDQVLTPVAVHDFDPEGRNAKGKPDPSENPQEVPLAIDDRGNTGWTTMTYATAALGGLKSGVGLLLDFGTDRSVGSVRLTLRGSPTSVDLYAASTGSDTPPTSLTGLRKVASVTADQRETTLRPGSPVKTRFVVVWLTRLPPYGHGFRGEIDQVTVLS
ncbi:protein kinase family protein [Nocardioides terrisoli]|uniref:protein kinase family protein n=1 Tax=Nocardioides terrisoli TaxID=3388267 RepID=UPI00287B883C|nr:protein kinase family protein [Nocardioides marmorisolisilvae]